MNMTGAIARGLRHHYLFQALSESQRALILERARIRDFSAGELLFSQGETAHSFHILQAGVVKLYRMSPDGQEKIMRLIRAGQSFAESVMFMDRPSYPVHGAGIEPGSLVAIDREGFLEILQVSFDTCRLVMAQMTQRIQAHWDEIETLSLQNSHYRVVHYLLGLVPTGSQGAAKIILPSRKVLIAAQLAISPETFSRALRSLSDKGLIKVDEETLHVPDIVALRHAIR